MKQLQWTPRRGIDATPALVVLCQPLAQVVGMADVKAAIGAFEDLQGELHFTGFLAGALDGGPSTSALRAYAQGERELSYRSP
jgi:hypothetical protein